MQSRHKPVVTVFGGSGFIGTQVVQDLAQKGYRVRVAVRRPELAGHVQMFGLVGQVLPVQANVRNKESVERALLGADYAINLTGILYQAGKQRFDAVHTEGAGTVAAAAKAAGVKGFVHMSALGADAASNSLYAQSKAAGEKAVLDAYADAVIVRPSLVFGADDNFFNMFGQLAVRSPILPVVGASTKFQPVYVGDVAQAIVKGMEGAVKGGKVYELGGPETETMKELMERVLKETERPRILLPLGAGTASLIASFAQLLPSPMLTTDQVRLLQTDNVVSEEAIKQKRTLAGFGIHPTAMDSILSTYMWQYRKNGQFSIRAEA